MEFLTERRDVVMHCAVYGRQVAACFCIFCSRATCSEFIPARSELQWSVVENSNSNLKTLILQERVFIFVFDTEKALFQVILGLL